jgi:hypothetical protein
MVYTLSVLKEALRRWAAGAGAAAAAGGDDSLGTVMELHGWPDACSWVRQQQL